MKPRFLAALGAYTVLALLAAFTLDGAVSIGGRQIDLRVVVWIFLGGLALKTWIAHRAGW